MRARAKVLSGGKGMLSLPLALFLGIAVGVTVDEGVRAGAQRALDVPNDAVASFHLMAEAWNTMHRYYVDRSALKGTMLTYGSISGMMEALGDTGHSTFLSPAMRKMERKLLGGQVEGIGVEVQAQGGHVVIVAPLDGTPAQRAGLRAGDIILRVDGQSVSGVPLIRAAERIAGPPGSSVTLSVLTPSTGQVREVHVVRAAFKVQNVTWQRLPGMRLAALRIAAFSQGVGNDLRLALTAMQREAVQGIVLDLRNDPGGSLLEAVTTASQFLADGKVLLMRDARGKITPVPVVKGGLALETPLVVLINGGTASAAEIVAGALQAAHRAPLIGEKTFGTGTVLQIFPLSDGSALQLAVEEWLTPSGKTIWHQGIAPDEVLRLAAHVRPVVPELLRGMSAEELRASKDTQLLRALEVLRSESKAPND